MYLFEGLKRKISHYLAPEQVSQVEAAFVLAERAHAGQMRSSGEPYITHPVAVSGILADMALDHETLMAALLHDVIEDTEYDKDDIEIAFGGVVAELVEGVSKLDKLKFETKQEAQAENFRKMLMAMVEDLRVILIKLADRTHNMRTLGALRRDKRHRIARETLDIYAPLAHRLGIHDIKNELENLGFEAMYPMRARALGSAMKQARGNRREIIEKTRDELTAKLTYHGIENQVIGREKHLYSIYCKMRSKERSFNEVMDIYGFRIIVASIDDCYRALGAVHRLYKPIETRFKDYIAIPRSNGYQSLHTSLKGPHGIPVEVQIRTQQMDMLADKGVAAHWQYKDTNPVDTTAKLRADQWMKSLLELQQNASSSLEFVESVKTDLFPDEIYVFTPKGRIIELPTGATPVDFAYAVHSDIGNSCVGARVERRNYSLRKPLQNGQTIEIITSPRAKPNANWLNFVVSARARSNIRQYLKRQQSEEAINLGARLLRHALGGQSLESISAEMIEQVVTDTKHANFNELLRSIGLGNEMSAIIGRRLLGEPELDITLSERSIGHKVAVKGSEGLLVHYSTCCHPIPDDEIVALLSPGRGLVIHQTGCTNIRKISREEPHRVLPMSWDPKVSGEFKTTIRVDINNNQDALVELTSAISAADSSITSLSSKEKDGNELSVYLELTVKNRIHLANVMRRLRALSDMLRVSRHSQYKSDDGHR